MQARRIQRRRAARRGQRNAARRAVAGDRELNKNRRSRRRTRLYFLHIPILRHLALDHIHIPAKARAEISSCLCDGTVGGIVACRGAGYIGRRCFSIVCFVLRLGRRLMLRWSFRERLGLQASAGACFSGMGTASGRGMGSCFCSSNAGATLGVSVASTLSVGG